MEIISFVDKNDFVKEGKWYFLSENSQWEISSTICRHLGNRCPFPSKVKNNLRGIDIPANALIVPLCSLIFS